MRGKLKKEGKYELFKTTHGHQILSLDDKKYYAIVEGQEGDIIVHSDSDHKKEKTLEKGQYYFADFDNDPEFQDMPHLFMEKGKQFMEMILPNGFPTKSNHQKKLVRTDNKIPQKKVEEHVKGKGNKGSEKQYQDKPEGLRTKSRNELYRMAKKEDIKGRSKMNKKELVKEVSKKKD